MRISSKLFFGFGFGCGFMDEILCFINKINCSINIFIFKYIYVLILGVSSLFPYIYIYNIHTNIQPFHELTPPFTPKLHHHKLPPPKNHSHLPYNLLHHPKTSKHRTNFHHSRQKITHKNQKRYNCTMFGGRSYCQYLHEFL